MPYYFGLRGRNSRYALVSLISFQTILAHLPPCCICTYYGCLHCLLHSIDCAHGTFLFQLPASLALASVPRALRGLVLLVSSRSFHLSTTVLFWMLTIPHCGYAFWLLSSLLVFLSLAAWAWNGAMSRRRGPKEENPRTLLAKMLPQMVRASVHE